MYKVDYTKQFFIDIWCIKTHIEFQLHNPESAKMIFNEIMDRADTLCDFPERYSKVLINNYVYHKMPVKKFIVYYSVDKSNQTVTVARVLYGGTDVNQVAIIN